MVALSVWSICCWTTLLTCTGPRGVLELQPVSPGCLLNAAQPHYSYWGMLCAHAGRRLVSRGPQCLLTLDNVVYLDRTAADLFITTLPYSGSTEPRIDACPLLKKDVANHEPSRLSRQLRDEGKREIWVSMHRKLFGNK